MEEQRSEVQEYPGLHSKFEASLSCRPCLKKPTKQKIIIKNKENTLQGACEQSLVSEPRRNDSRVTLVASTFIPIKYGQEQSRVVSDCDPSTEEAETVGLL